MRGGRPRDGSVELSPRPWWFGPAALAPPGPEAPFDLVLLDRDGTLNVRVEGGYVTRPEDLVLLPGTGRALSRIAAAGCRTVVLTNQRALARGLMSRRDLEAVHRRLVDLVSEDGGRIDAVAVCPHAEGACDCRKPRDGLFREVLARAPWAQANRCLMLGDMPSDLEPAQLLTMRTRRVGPDEGIEPSVRDLFGASGLS